MVRVMTVTTALAQNPRPDLLPPEHSAIELQLHSIRSFAGSQAIQALQTALRPVALAKYSVDQLRGLCHLLFGLMMAISYS